MKKIIVIIGNMASGKSTASKLLAQRLPNYQYICQDDFRNEKTDLYLEIENKEFELQVSDNAIQAINRYSKIIYESTGATRFFRDRYYEFLNKGHELFVVRIKCRPTTCYQRFLKRRAEGKNHLVPIFKVSKTPMEMINLFEKKSQWVKANLEIDSEKFSTEQIVDQIIKAYPGESPHLELEELIKHFNYAKALAWINTHVTGQNFLKEMLANGEDKFNTVKIKKLLNEQLELQKNPAPKKAPISKASKTYNEDEIEDLVNDAIEEKVEDLREEIREEIREEFQELKEKATQAKNEEELDALWKPIYKEANHYFTIIDFEQDADKRKEIAFKILDMMDEVEAIWAKRDFKKKFGVMPEFQDKGIDNLTIEQMATRIRTLRTYITKAHKGKLKPERIPEWKAEIEELERRLRQ
jgi:dephospho-CoA kinase